MNDKLKEITQKYEVAEEQITEILVGIGVKNIDNPGKRQLEGLEQACVLIKEGKPVEEAIAIIREEAKAESRETQLANEADWSDEKENLIRGLAKQAAKKNAEIFLKQDLPQLLLQGRQQAREVAREEYAKTFEASIAETLQGTNYYEWLEDVMEGQELGKPNLFNGTHCNTRLLNSSSTNDS